MKNKTEKKRSWKLLKRSTLILMIAGLLFAHFYAPRFITEIKNPLLDLVRPHKLAATSFDFENNNYKGKYIYFKSYDKTELSAYLTYSKQDYTKGTVILLHGIRSQKECYIDLSRRLAEVGYNTVALDSRAHGQSGGTHCTFGVKEKTDISSLVDFLEKEEQIKGNIGVWGRSLGGAIGLQAMGIDKRIKYGIIESTFTDFGTITGDYSSYHLGFSLEPLTNYLLYRAGEIADFDPEEACPSNYCEKITQPILIVHGDKDKRINIKYGKENYAKLASTDKAFLEIKGASHLNVWNIGGDKYFEKVINFLDENIN